MDTSGSDEGFLRALQCMRSRRLDADVDELARGGGSAEVDGRVAPRAAAKQRRVRARRAFDEHLLDASDAGLIALAGDPLRQLDQPLHPLDLDLVRHLPWHGRRLGAGAWRVDE